MSKITRSSGRIAYVPEWISQEVHAALGAIQGEHVAKKEATVLRLAQAAATNQSQASVFEMADTCSSNIWHGRGGKPGWKDDPVIAHAYKVAEARARWWMRVRMGRAEEEAADTIVDAAPEAAEQLVRMATRGAVRVRVGDEDAPVNMPVAAPQILQAIVSLLDRTGLKTASKARMELTGAGGGPIGVKDETPDLTKLSDGDLVALRDLLAKAAADETVAR